MSFLPGLLDMLPVLHSKDISTIHDADFDWGEEIELAFPVKISDYLWSPSISLSISSELIQDVWRDLFASHWFVLSNMTTWPFVHLIQKEPEMNEHEWGMNIKNGKHGHGKNSRVQVVARKFVNDFVTRVPWLPSPTSPLQLQWSAAVQEASLWMKLTWKHEKRGPKNLQKRKAVKQTSLEGSNEAFSLLHG